jgi:hypothetical protein
LAASEGFICGNDRVHETRALAEEAASKTGQTVKSVAMMDLGELSAASEGFICNGIVYETRALAEEAASKTGQPVKSVAMMELGELGGAKMPPARASSAAVSSTRRARSPRRRRARPGSLSSPSP